MKYLDPLKLMDHPHDPEEACFNPQEWAHLVRTREMTDSQERVPEAMRRAAELLDVLASMIECGIVDETNLEAVHLNVMNAVARVVNSISDWHDEVCGEDAQ
jgi:hypothetical protein